MILRFIFVRVRDGVRVRHVVVMSRVSVWSSEFIIDNENPHKYRRTCACACVCARRPVPTHCCVLLICALKCPLLVGTDYQTAPCLLDPKGTFRIYNFQNGEIDLFNSNENMSMYRFKIFKIQKRRTIHANALFTVSNLFFLIFFNLLTTVLRRVTTRCIREKSREVFSF